MAGFDWIITFPPLNSGTGFSFKSALEMGASGCGVIHSYADHPTVVESRYIDLFFRTK